MSPHVHAGPQRGRNSMPPRNPLLLQCVFGKCSTGLVFVVVLVLVIEKSQKSEDEQEDVDEQEGRIWSSKHALRPAIPFGPPLLGACEAGPAACK